MSSPRSPSGCDAPANACLDRRMTGAQNISRTLQSCRDFDAVPYAERCQRIGELLSKAVVGHFRHQHMEAIASPTTRSKPSGRIGPADLVTDEIEKQMIRHLMLAGQATPLDFCTVLHISPATAFRRLARLRTAGYVRVNGKSRAARYHLADFPGKN